MREGFAPLRKEVKSWSALRWRIRFVLTLIGTAISVGGASGIHPGSLLNQLTRRNNPYTMTIANQSKQNNALELFRLFGLAI